MLTRYDQRKFLAFIISYFTKLDMEYILKTMQLRNTDIINDLSKKTGNGDIVVEVENKIINIEMNRKVTEALIRKNK